MTQGLTRRRGLRAVSDRRAARDGAPRGSTLNPGAGLRRSAPLAPGGSLARRVTLARYTPLRAWTPLAPVSEKRAAANRRRRAVIAVLYPERPLCAVPWCTDWADDVHEVLPRARGGAIDDPDLMAAVCRPHHDDLTNEAPWGYEVGLLFHSWSPPGGDAA